MSSYLPECEAFAFPNISFSPGVKSLSLSVLVTFNIAETKYPALRVKGGKAYLAHSLWRFQSIVSWLQARMAHGKGQPFVARQQARGERASLFLSLYPAQSANPTAGVALTLVYPALRRELITTPEAATMTA